MSGCPPLPAFAMQRASAGLTLTSAIMIATQAPPYPSLTFCSFCLHNWFLVSKIFKKNARTIHAGFVFIFTYKFSTHFGI